MVKEKNSKNSFFKSLLQFLIIFALAFCCVFLLNTYVIDGYTVEGTSMLPNYKDGERILGLKVGSLAQKGDVVVIYASKEMVAANSQLYEGEMLLKRVVATAGDTVCIVNGWLCVNGQVQEEEIRQGNQLAAFHTDTFLYLSSTPQEVPKGTVFVLGDNRAPFASLDSRMFGFVPLECIVAKVISLKS